MERLQLCLRPGDTSIHPVADLLLGADYVDRAELWHWNVTDRPVALMFHVRGDPDRLAAAVDDVDTVIDHQTVPVGEDSFYFYNFDECTDFAYRLFESFGTPGLVAQPGIRYEDGEIRATVFGDRDVLRDLVASVPDAIDVSLEQLGTYDPSEGPGPLGALSERQREALTAAVEVGYYDVPRTGDHEAVADRLDCAPSTAAEHIRKAEATLVTDLVDGR